MRLGFHYHIPAMRDANGNILLPGYLGVFLDAMAKEVDELILYMHTPLKHEVPQMDYQLEGKNIELVDIGAHTSFYKRILKRKMALEAVEKDQKRLDLLLLRAPSPILPFIAARCKKLKIPYAYLVVGDYVKTLQGASGMGGLKKTLLGGYYHLNRFFQEKYAAFALIFANNQTSYDEYKLRFSQTHLVRTTTLSTDDFFHREDTCLGDEVHLIYAGRIEPTKGMEDVLHAMQQLKIPDKKVVLNLVGWDPSEDDAHLNFLYEKTKVLGLEENFVFHGKKRVGEELLSMYRQADIFILATKGNEGFPRTIWEAMASSMPVIATKVGSIPSVLEHERHAYLINEASPQEITMAIENVVLNKDLRQTLMKEGLVLAKDNTNEIQANRMSEIMNEFLQDRVDV